MTTQLESDLFSSSLLLGPSRHPPTSPFLEPLPAPAIDQGPLITTPMIPQPTLSQPAQAPVTTQPAPPRTPTSTSVSVPDPAQRVRFSPVFRPAEPQRPSTSSQPLLPLLLDDHHASITESHLQKSVTLSEFRILLGVPRGNGNATSRLPRWWPHERHILLRVNDEETNMGIYLTILRQEKISTRQSKMYNSLVYGSLIIQLIVSALLVMLAAMPQDHHISLAILGAANGVITGTLSLIRGQGLPNRLIQYRDGLRRVRERIEWLEKELQLGKRPIAYREIVLVREMYQQIRDDQQQNHPDSWMSGVHSKAAPGPVMPATSVAH